MPSSKTAPTDDGSGPTALPPGPFAPARPVSAVDSQVFDEALAAAAVRALPYPFDSAMAVASDIDGSSRETFTAYTRMLVHDLGLDFGDSAWLHWRYSFNREGVKSLTNSVGFLSPSLTEQTTDDARFFRRNPNFHELLAEYHEGTIDHFHALLPHGPRIAVLTDVARDGADIAADIPPLDVSCADFHLFGILFVFDGTVDVSVESVRAQCAGGETVDYAPAAYDPPDDGKRYALFVRDPGPKGDASVPHLRDVVRIMGESASLPERIILAGAFGPMLLDRLRHLREEFNAELPLITAHARLHFRYPEATERLRRSNAEKLQSQSDSLFAFVGPVEDSRGRLIASTDSDEPHSLAKLLPEAVEEAELRFIVPIASSGSGGFHVTDLLAGSPTRSGGGFYWAKRTMPHSADPDLDLAGPPKHASFGSRLQGAMNAATTRPGDYWPIYTHIGSLARINGKRIDLPVPYFEPAPLLELQDRAFGITADVPRNGRIWFARASTLYDYALMVQGVADHMKRDGANSVRLSSWQDPILGKAVPRTPSQLYGLTFYVEDESAAEVSLDGVAIERLARNPADASGSPSVTIAECDIAATVFRALDPAASADASLADGEWQWVTGEVPFGRLQSTRTSVTAKLRVPLGGLFLPGAQLLSLRLRAPGRECGVLFESRSGGRFWFGTAALARDLGSFTAIYSIDRLLKGEDWKRVVVPFHDLDWSVDARPGGPLPSHPIEAMTLVSRGAAEFSDVQLLRPRVSTQARRPGAGHCIVGLLPGAGVGETVRLTSRDGPKRSRIAQTDQLGWFSFSRVEPGIYDIVGSLGGVECRSPRGRLIEVWSDIARLELSEAIRPSL